MGNGCRRRFISALKLWFATETALNCGLRISEIVKLRLGDVHLGEEGGWLFIKNGKGGKERVVYFGRRYSETVRRYIRLLETAGCGLTSDEPLLSGRNGAPISTRALQRSFASALKVAGIRKVSFHALRHTYATALYHASGNNIRLVQKQLGHSSIVTTQVYADVCTDEHTKTFDSLY